MGMGRSAEEVRVERGRLHLYSALHHAPALRDCGDAAHHDEQPHRQGDGLRLVRSSGKRAGIRGWPTAGAVKLNALPARALRRYRVIGGNARRTTSVNALMSAGIKDARVIHSDR